MRVLVTDGGNHTPETWASETTRGLVSIDPDAPNERLEAALSLRKKIGAVLLNHFKAVHASNSAAELEKIGKSAAEGVFSCAKGSPWEIHFSEPHIRSAMVLTIQRNINTAADLAVKAE